MDDKELDRLADIAATKAAKHVFAILGVDIESPSEVEGFRENMRFAANMRRATDRWQLAIISVFAGGVGMLLLKGFLASTGGH